MNTTMVVNDSLLELNNRKLNMRKMSDIENLYQTIEQNPESYQEIVQAEQANESLGRWSLISAIHQIDDIKEAHSIHPKVAVKPAQAQKKAIEKNIKQTVALVELEIEVREDEELPARQRQAFESLRESQSLGIQAIQSVQLDRALNALVADTAHIKSASSESISSLFERLKRS